MIILQRTLNPATLACTLLLCAAACACAQSENQPKPPANPNTPGTTTPGAAGTTGTSAAITQKSPAPIGANAPSAAAQPAEGILVDQVIAVVNGDLILESDIEEDQRLAAFQPIRSAVLGDTRQDIVQRLIDRDLILQEAKLQPEDSVTLAEASTELLAQRKEVPACVQYHCETEAGWARFVAAQGFTLPELTARWQQRMEVLKFIEERFRTGIRIDPAEIQAYYTKTLLPEYAKQHAPAPKLDAISDRIREILLQQQVTALLDDWLKTLKAQGSVRIIKPGEVAQ